MATVQVGCKLPAGLIMELIEVNKDSPTQPMPRDPDKPLVFLKGPSSARVHTPNPLQHAFVLTEVEESFAREWFRRNKDAAFIKNGMVFLQEKAQDGKAVAKERRDITTGFESINPKSDPRLAGVEADKDHLKRLGVA